jgi:uncharacterized repeat protein (TIGR04052 family)
MEPVSLQFSLVDSTAVAQSAQSIKAQHFVDEGDEVSCDDILTGFGADGTSSVGVSDLRFYVSNVKFYDENGNELAAEFDSNTFQYVGDTGVATLIDFTSNTSGSCTNSAIAFSEGTERVNRQVSAFVASGNITKVTFDVGIPQSLMKQTIATHTAEDVPSPFGELYWSWASGYRYFVLNFTITDGNGVPGEGYLHIGSRDCGGDGARALTDRESCGILNMPTVSLDGFDPREHTVTLDIRAILAGMRFITTIYDTEPPFDILGEGPGVACHSAPVDIQPDCGPLFDNFGIDRSSGQSSSALNKVFSYE